MSSTSPPSIELDFFMQGITEREKESDKDQLLEHGKRRRHRSKLVLRRSLKKHENLHSEIALISKFLQ